MLIDYKQDPRDLIYMTFNNDAITDTGNLGFKWEALGSPVLSEDRKEGTHSAYFNGSNYLKSILPSADFLDHDFTFDCWIKGTSMGSGACYRTFGIGDNAGSASFLSIGYSLNCGERLHNKWNVTTNKAINACIGTDTGEYLDLSADMPSGIAVGDWFHYAIVRSNNRLLFYINANLLISHPFDYTISKKLSSKIITINARTVTNPFEISVNNIDMLRFCNFAREFHFFKRKYLSMY